MPAETLTTEFDRLVREYREVDESDPTKGEAWNLIADFAVENADALIAALSVQDGAVSVKALDWEWLPYPGEDHQPLCDVLVVGQVQRFYDDAPTYAEALGKRLGAVSTDAEAREKVEARIRSALTSPSPTQEAGTEPELTDEIDSLARSVGKRFIPSHSSQTNPVVSHETENVTHKPTITDEMVERAARAMVKATGLNPDEPTMASGSADGATVTADVYERRWQRCRGQARAALTAALSDDGGGQ